MGCYLLPGNAFFCREQVKRHQIVHQHYSDIAEVVDSDPEAGMTQVLRAKRPGAKVRQRV